jgi:hypothetical protein
VATLAPAVNAGRGDQRVKCLDRVADPAAGNHDLGIPGGRGSVIGQDSAGQILGEHGLGRD